MGSLKLPDSGTVYVDADCVIYGVEKVEPYSTLILTNDPAFCRVEGLPVQILSELLSTSD